MNKRSEQAALKAYPEEMGMFYEADIHYEADLNKAARIKYIEGYEQAEKDLALTWEDIRSIIELYERRKAEDAAFDAGDYEALLYEFSEQRKK